MATTLGGDLPPPFPLPAGTLPRADAAAGASSVLRSDQLDAPLLDAALLSLLVPRVRSMFKHLPLPASLSFAAGSGPTDREVDALVHAALAALTTALTVGRGLPSPAMRALGLGMRPAAVGGASAGTTMRRAAALAALSAAIPALFRIAESRRTGDGDGEGGRGEERGEGRRRRLRRRRGRRDAAATQAPATETMESLARRRRKSVLRFVVRLASVIVPPLRLANYLAFLFSSRRGNGSLIDGGTADGLPGEAEAEAARGEPPATVPMRLAGLAYAPSTPQEGSEWAGAAGGAGAERHVNFSYAYRRLLYEEAYALAKITLLPSARAAAAAAPALRERARRLRRRATGAVRAALPLPRAAASGGGGRGDGSGGGVDDDGGEEAPCPVCSRSPYASVPYAPRPCGHVHCYVCLRTAALDDPGYGCRRCGARVESSGPA